MSKKSKYEYYLHNGWMVWVNKRLKDTHKEHCLCYSCTRFHPGLPEHNCPIANLNYAICIECGITTPVFECPKFKEKE